ncbi:LCP family protein [Vagococcus fluvialis]|uniref:LCP family protein n=1 Tax=Vagococcus fluvialis TaxID=2738 RepID=UPI003B59D042
MSDMTRMERHRQAEKEKQAKIDKKNQKKQGKKDNIEEPISPGQPPKGKKTRKKRKKLRIFLTILLVLIALFGFGYMKGYMKTKMDKNNLQPDVGNFMGDKSMDGSTNILLLGSDSRGEDQGRSDTIMIAHYDKKNKQPKIVSIMRDTLVPIPTKDGVEYNKINAAYAYGGPDMVRKTIKDTFGIPIQYYAIVNFESFPKIVDTLAPNGLKIDAEKDLEVEGTVIKKGPQKMNGNEALQYARFRKDEEGDFGRVRRQQQVMTALLSQSLNPLNAWRIPEALGVVRGYTQTDIPFGFYPSTGTSYLFSRHKPLEILTVPVEGTWTDGYYDYAGSVLEIDEAANAEAIKNFFNH